MCIRLIGALIVAGVLSLPAGVYADPELAEEAAQAVAAGENSAPASDPGNPEAQAWPRQITTDQYTLYLYAPHVESWDQKLLQARAAVAVQSADAAEPTYGVVWLTAHTAVDDQKGIVSLQDLTVTKGTFPSAPDGGPDYLALVRQNVPAATRTIGLSRLQGDLAAARAVEKSRAAALKNDPPRIIFSTTKAMLVLIDGAPVLRPVPGTKLSRVVNTRSLLLTDQAKSAYYLYLVDRWLTATSIDGPWSEVQDLPDGLDAAKQAAVASKQVDLLDQAGSDARMAVDWGTFPTVYTSTAPAELIQAPGPLMMTPIEGTQLQQVQNSNDNIFQNTATQDYYVLVSGRWFRSPSLNGPWAFVAANALPADFAKIPPDSLASTVLASVAGTPQAQQALVDNLVPQTATVNRKQARLSPRFDGALQFRPIAGTALRYVANSATPIIQSRNGPYYAVEHGVWFLAQAATGPWEVAASVPAEIYAMPPSAPLYYTTFVNIYGATDDEVYVGSTPGYFGAYAVPEGVVVYGTGWAYEPWLGAYWIGAPRTFGFDADLAWDAVSGYGVGFGDDLYFGPWWGPLGARWAEGLDWRFRTFAAADLYGRWGPMVRDTASARATAAALGDWRADMYAGRDGYVYRRGERGWEGNIGGDWRRGGMEGAGLERQWMGRQMAMDRMGAYRGAAFGGGFGGGFGGSRRR